MTVKLSEKQESIITRIKEAYDEYPFPETDEMESELSQLMNKLKIKQEEFGADITDSEVALELKNMDCFSHRAHKHNGSELIFWNPLEQKFRDFKNKNSTNKISFYQAHQEHPAPDIIYNWAMSQLK